MNSFVELSESEAIDVNAGGVVGAIVGGIFGFDAGCLISCGAAIANGSDFSLNDMWKIVTSSTIGGASVGCLAPV